MADIHRNPSTGSVDLGERAAAIEQLAGQQSANGHWRMAIRMMPGCRGRRAIAMKWMSQRLSSRTRAGARLVRRRRRTGRRRPAAAGAGRLVHGSGGGLGGAEVAERADAEGRADGSVVGVEQRRSSSSRSGGGGRKARAASASAPRIARTTSGSVQRARSARKLGAGLVAVVGVLGHQLADDRRERRGHAPGHPLERLGVVHPLLEDLVDDVAPLERRAAGEGEVERAADAVEVAPAVGARRRCRAARGWRSRACR